MRRLLVIPVVVVSLCSVAGADNSRPPLSKNDILGRLASGSSPSYIAHLVKIRGISFLADDTFLSYVKDAGGEGILLDTINAASPGDHDSLPSNNDDLLVHIARCAALQRSGEMSKAANQCEAAADASPKDPLALLAEERCANNDGRGDSPVPFLQQAATLAPGLAEVRLAMSGYPKDDDSVDSEFDKALKLDPDELDAALRSLNPAPKMENLPREPVAVLLPEADTYDPSSDGNGESSAETISELPPPPPPPMMRDDQPLRPLYVADVNSETERLHELLNVEPNYAPAHAVLAEELFYQNEREDALEEMRKAVGLEPGQVSYHLAMADLLEQFNPKDDGSKSSITSELTAAVTIRPADAELHERLGGALEQLLNDPDEAVTEYQACLQIDPTLPSCHRDLVELDEHQGRAEDEIREFRRYLGATRAQDTFERFNFARVLTNNRELSDAAEQCEQALAVDPDNAYGHYTFARVRYLQGYLPDAIYEDREAIRLGPGSDDYYLDLAFILTAAEKPDDAVDTYKQALKLWPEDAEAHNDLAWFYATYSDAKYRNIPRAFAEANKAVELSHWQEPNFIDTLAESEFQNHQFDQAIIDETKALALDPKNTILRGQLERFKKRDLSIPPPSN